MQRPCIRITHLLRWAGTTHTRCGEEVIALVEHPVDRAAATGQLSSKRVRRHIAATHGGCSRPTAGRQLGVGALRRLVEAGWCAGIVGGAANTQMVCQACANDLLVQRANGDLRAGSCGSTGDAHGAHGCAALAVEATTNDDGVGSWATHAGQLVGPAPVAVAARESGTEAGGIAEAGCVQLASGIGGALDAAVGCDTGGEGGGIDAAGFTRCQGAGHSEALRQGTAISSAADHCQVGD